ncbi:hypothetical protein SOVF_216000 [Spinacia oleracea]|nr:hypothetical protein SOVF_216000 [Spinacia oleracea]
MAPLKPSQATLTRKSARTKFVIDNADPNFVVRLVLEVGAKDLDGDKIPTP